MEPRDPLSAARAAVRAGIGDGVFPAAVAEVGSTERVLWREAFGSRDGDDAHPAGDDTIFDLASLTKPIATTTLALDHVAHGRLAIDDRVADYFPEWRGDAREPVTVRDLLEHASGLPPRLLDAPPAGRREFEHDICTLPLEYQPRTRSVYSDLDFILLGFLIADIGGARLDEQFRRILAGTSTRSTSQSDGSAGSDVWIGFDVDAGNRARTAPTLPLEEDRRRGRTLLGEVHDPYAAALGGVAGHAGLFGTAGSVGAFARMVLRASRGDESRPDPFSPSCVRLATRRSSVPGSSRALGWDTMLPTSSCGAHMSPTAFGHVGFTGTSLWLDPERDRYFVLLTNRAFTRATTDQLQRVRRAFHDGLAYF